jgi:hypothetical protein
MLGPEVNKIQTVGFNFDPRISSRMLSIVCHARECEGIIQGRPKQGASSQAISAVV